MRTPSWDDVFELPDDLDDETAERLHESADEIQDMTGEGCPSPKVAAKKAIQTIESGGVLVQKTDHVPNTETVPNAVEELADAKGWQSGNGRYRSSLSKY